MKVLISGAGVAGLAVAYWLERYGFSPTIVERAPALRTGGYKIDARGKALEVLRRMGIYEEVKASGTDMQGATIVDHNGKVIAEMSGDAFGLREGDDLEIVRGDLCQIMRQKVKNTEFLFGDSISAITQHATGVTVTFEKNSARDFDLVIGADGLHSTVRRLVFGDEANFARHLGLYLCVYSVPNTLNLDRWEMEYTDLGKIANVWSSRGGKDAKACFGFTAPEYQFDPRDVSSQRQLVKTVYKDIGWQVPRLLQEMDNTPDFYFDAATLICMDHYAKKRVVLLGDAGYCASPMSGQGTSLALIGAYLLAGELAKASPNYQKAFTEYERLMRPFVKANQALGIKSASLMQAREKKGPLLWLHEIMRKIAPGWWVEFFTNRAKKRISKAANGITLAEYTQ